MLHHFCPDVAVARLTDLSPAFFTGRGLRAVLLDLDNTLAPWRGSEIPPETARWVEEARRAGLKLCICSNTHRPRRLAQLAGRLGIPYIEGMAKPRRGGFLRALALLEAQPEETAVVGDQLLTDVWGGNRCGLTTILVAPLSPVEFIGTRLVSRTLEGLLMARMRKAGIWKSWSPDEATAAAGDNHE